MIRTALTDMLACRVPIQLAAMPGVATPELVSAVAAAGAVAMLPTPLLPPADLEAQLDALGDGSPGAIGANFLMPFLDRDCVAIAARRVQLVEFFYGEPDRSLVAKVHAHGARVGWQVGSLAEARAAEAAGCDLLVAQGTEAGGHVRGQIGVLPLLGQVLEAVRVPVLAAGGIATARSLAAVLAAGACGARIGTRFIASLESGAHPDYVRAVLGAGAEDTVLTSAFSVGWPDAPHRVLASAVTASAGLAEEVIGAMQLGGRTIPIQRGSVICPSRHTTGRIDAMALYAGQSAADVRDVQPAAAIVEALVSGAERRLTACADPRTQ